MSRLDHAQTLLGHRFVRPELLAEALTHRSAAGAKGVGSNERLEFIGDRVLGLIVAEWLIERFPNEQEGKLGPRMAALVSKPALAEIAQNNGLAPLLNVAAGESKRGVRNQATVLADALEAVIGALYLDAGLDASRHFIRRVMGDVVDKQFIPPKDPKTALQEWVLKRALPLPAYEVVEMSGPSHAPRFVIKVSVGDAAGRGEAGSKRAAEQAAAQALLGVLPE
ncbi:ribonuclease III [Acidocella sp.]|uniref:ribonuclease III n=1 Tax=Acidocella sp. TaxID=50710 RepID=UPI001803C22A|nr:ribonuclease III [Acidocella sp.]NNM56340.1 ribonuclease III [Acidocella sp.]